MKKQIICGLLFVMFILQGCLNETYMDAGKMEKDNWIYKGTIKIVNACEIKELKENGDLSSILEDETSKVAFYDVNTDGRNEVIIKTSKELYVLLRKEYNFEIIYRGAYSMLLENGMIQYYRPGGAPLHEDYTYYSLEENGYKEEVMLARYDANDNNMYDEQDIYFQNEFLITMEEWDGILQKYQAYGEAELFGYYEASFPNILEAMKNGMNDETLQSYYAEDIYDVKTMTNGTIDIRYYDVDLNSDKLDDKLVIIRSPLHSGTAGDKFAILLNDGKSYTEITEVSWYLSLLYQDNNYTPVGAVYVLKNETNGFRDIEIVSGDNRFILKYIDEKYVRIQ